MCLDELAHPIVDAAGHGGNRSRLQSHDVCGQLADARMLVDDVGRQLSVQGDALTSEMALRHTAHRLQNVADASRVQRVEAEGEELSVEIERPSQALFTAQCGYDGFAHDRLSVRRVAERDLRLVAAAPRPFERLVRALDQLGVALVDHRALD